MNFKKISCFVFCTILTLSAATSSANADVNTPKRLAGIGRFETSTAISNYFWNNANADWTSTSKDKSDYAVLVTGITFPDALCAAPLAKKYNAPILLVTKDSLDNTTTPATVTSELKRLKVQKVFIIGGEGVISKKVEQQLDSLKIGHERFAGKDREETSLSVAKAIGTSSGVFVTEGYSDFSDALSVSSIAAINQMPIILVSKTSVSPETKKFLKNNTIPSSVIIGDETIISKSVADLFPTPLVIKGKDKYERNRAVIISFLQSFDLTNIYIATGNDFPDALSGSVIAAIKSAPIILSGDTLSEETGGFLTANAEKINNVILLGGEGVVKPVLVQSIQKTIIDNKVLKVISID